MRRADYERALPVLQHAQNLNPADPRILGLLRRARAGQPLDPPPPIPTPLSPTAGGRRASAAQAAARRPDYEQRLSDRGRPDQRADQGGRRDRHRA